MSSRAPAFTICSSTQPILGLLTPVFNLPSEKVPAPPAPQKGVQGPVYVEDVDQWCEWYKAGRNVADIAEMARRSKATVAARLRTRGLLPDPVPRVTDEEVREMARLFASGLSVREVAKATKRNMRTVREHLRETRAIR